MDRDLYIALVGALITALLSLLISSLMEKESDSGFLGQVKSVYVVSKKHILTSSVLAGLTIFLTLKLTPVVARSLNIKLDGASGKSSGSSDGLPSAFQQFHNLSKLIK